MTTQPKHNVTTERATDLLKDGLSGMTVNERLFVCELMNEFDKALTVDKSKAKKILELLGIDKPSIDKIVK